MVLARAKFPSDPVFAFDGEIPTPLRSLLFKTIDRCLLPW
jgi:hypothetical protein